MSRILETVIADAAPNEQRLEMFQRLAKLELNYSKSFNEWADEWELSDADREMSFKAWRAAWEKIHADTMWECLRTLAVLDESFRLPQLKAGSDEFRGNVERKFAAMMQRISLLALTIQREYELKSKIEVTDGSSNPDSKRND